MAVDNIAFIEVIVNKVNVPPSEIVMCRIEIELGNIMPKLELKLKTRRKILFENCLIEMSKIFIEIGSSKLKSKCHTKKAKFFVVKSNFESKSEETGEFEYLIYITGIADSFKYLSNTQLMSLNEKGNSIQFIKRLSGIDTTGSNGNIKLVDKDGIEGLAKDKMFWIQNDKSAIETVSNVANRGMIDSSSKKWMFVPVIDFDTKGSPELLLYDFLKRSKATEYREVDAYACNPKKKLKFTYLQNDTDIAYQEALIDYQGSDYSSIYWKRKALIFNQEENIHIHRDIDVPLLFNDSMPYLDVSDGNYPEINGNDSLPDSMHIFQSAMRYNKQTFNKNMYGQNGTSEMALQHIQTQCSLLALKKINFVLTFPGLLLMVTPMDLCHLTIRGEMKDNKITKDPKFTGDYLITKVVYYYVNADITTCLTVSRDTLVKNSDTKK